LNYVDRFPKSIQIINPTKIHPLAHSCSMRTDGRTNRHDKANSRFSQILGTRLKR